MSEIFNENGTPSSTVSSLSSLYSVAFTTFLVLAYSSNSFANRPSMQDNDYAADHQENTSPSSVELMMQQQHTGDILNLPAQEIQPGETIKIKLLDLPRRGASMTKVKQAFGEPMSASDSVGKPPITRWIYPDRIVYFEYSTVLHVVAR